MQTKTAFQRISIFTGLLALAVLSCSGASGISNLFATDTPTPTNTFTPSPTLTPSPTSTPTVTPSPTSTPLPTGSNTEEQVDGSMLFTDYDNGYQLTLPEGWFILPLSSKDLADILASMSEENPDVKEAAESLKGLDPDVIRVMAFNKHPEYNASGFTTNLVVTAVDDKFITSMPMEFVMGYLEESITQQGGQVLSTDSVVTTNASGVEIGSFDFTQPAPTAIGSKITARVKTIIFRIADKMIMVQLTAPQQFAEELFPVINQISESVKPLEEQD